MRTSFRNNALIASLIIITILASLFQNNAKAVTDDSPSLVIIGAKDIPFGGRAHLRLDYDLWNNFSGSVGSARVWAGISSWTYNIPDGNDNNISGIIDIYI